MRALCLSAVLPGNPPHIRSFARRRYGSRFGKQPSFWDVAERALNKFPRVRVRTASERALEEFLELAVVNERLNGTPAHEVRHRLDYLRRNRKNWCAAGGGRGVVL